MTTPQQATQNSVCSPILAVLESMTDALIVLDWDFRFLFANHAAEILWSKTQSDLCGRTLWEVYPEGMASHFERQLMAAASRRMTMEFEATFPLNNRCQTVRIIPARSGLVIYFHEVSDTRQTAEELHRRYAELQESSNAKDLFLAVLSHELRIPLTPVLGIASSLQSDERIPQAVRDDLAVIQRNAELEARLIDDLLDVNRIAHGKLSLQLEPVRLDAAIRHVIDICRAEISDKMLLVKLTPPSPPETWVRADPARLQQVLGNLLKNAIKFSETSQTILLELLDTHEGYAAIKITDCGIGIEQDALDRIFRPFEQGNPDIYRRFGGLGLGLAISKTLVEAQGGTLLAQSDGRGKGASFTLTLPTAKPVYEKKYDLKPECPHAFRILLVEDHRDSARVIARILESQGHTLFIASDLATALEHDSQNQLDLVLSDIGLPDGTGYELLAKMKQRVPAIALTGFGMEEDIKNSKEAGFCVHLTKPIDFRDLLDAISLVAANQTQTRD